TYFVILEGEKLDSSFYEEVLKHILVLDLTKEKPWDRKARILSWLSGFAKKEKKELSQELADHLYENTNKDLSLMLQELSKLLCFAKDSTKLTLEHYKEISSS